MANEELNYEEVNENSEGSINVELSSLAEAYSRIRSILERMSAAFDNAENAGKESVLAVGGEGTKVGTAIVNAVVNVNKDTFNTAKQNIFNYLDGIRIAHDSLSEEENALVNIISQSAEGYVSSSVSNEEKSV